MSLASVWMMNTLSMSGYVRVREFVDKYAISYPYALVVDFVFGIEAIISFCIRGDAVFKVPRVCGVVWEPVIWVNWWCGRL